MSSLPSSVAAHTTATSALGEGGRGLGEGGRGLGEGGRGLGEGGRVTRLPPDPLGVGQPIPVWTIPTSSMHHAVGWAGSERQMPVRQGSVPQRWWPTDSNCWFSDGISEFAFCRWQSRDLSRSGYRTGTTLVKPLGETTSKRGC